MRSRLLTASVRLDRALHALPRCSRLGALKAAGCTRPSCADGAVDASSALGRRRVTTYSNNYLCDISHYQSHPAQEGNIERVRAAVYEPDAIRGGSRRLRASCLLPGAGGPPDRATQATCVGRRNCRRQCFPPTCSTTTHCSASSSFLCSVLSYFGGMRRALLSRSASTSPPFTPLLHRDCGFQSVGFVFFVASCTL